MTRLRALRLGFIGIASLLTLAACVNTTTRAPVIERVSKAPPASTPSITPVPTPAPSIKSSNQPDWRPPSYTVQKGDTLYSIALEHGHDYKDIAAWNGIQAPYTIGIGQVLQLASPIASAAQPDGTSPLKTAPILDAKPLAVSSEAIRLSEPKALKRTYSEQALAQMLKETGKASNTTTLTEAGPKPETLPKPENAPEVANIPPPKPTPVPDTAKSPVTPEDEDKIDWSWPAEGKILANFNDNGNAKGLDIGGNLGQPVTAAAAGKVVHTGSTLRGYGKLIIIKHNKNYFSVYAHNNHVLVREGQNVVKGQRVGEMGSSDADRVKLHFEIRHLGKPVDPLKYLPNDRTS